MLGDDGDAVGNKVCGVETNTELTNHGNVGTGGEGLHELLGAGAGDRTKVVDKVGLGHANASVAEAEHLLLLVRGDADVEVLLGLEGGGVGEGLVTDLVEGIGRVGDDFTQEDLLVGVERVWLTRKRDVQPGFWASKAEAHRGTH